MEVRDYYLDRSTAHSSDTLFTLAINLDFKIS